MLRTCTHGQRIRIDTWLDDDLWPAMVEPSQVEAAILNLALNARDAMPDGGVLTITTSNQPIVDAVRDDYAAGDYVAIIVTDTGVGMTDEVAQRAFEPFFTTKHPAGSGLGLSQVYSMGHESGGTVRLLTSPGSGTSVTMLLPRAAEMPRPRRPQMDQRRARSGMKVLVADDDPDVLSGPRRDAAPTRLYCDHGDECSRGAGCTCDEASDRNAGPCYAWDDWATGRR